MKYFQAFSEYDLFGRNPSLYIEGRELFGTPFGLILTLVALVCYLVCGIYFILEMFDKTNEIHIHLFKIQRFLYLLILLLTNFISDLLYKIQVLMILF